MKNNKINHHYISQVEQRLNAIDPTKRKEKQRIYEFEIINHEKHTIKLTNASGRKIEKNLSYDDLYSFDLLDDNYRLNFEDEFSKFEAKIGQSTKHLLEKIEINTPPSVGEIFNILALKMLNSFRNPNCILETNKTIDLISKCIPKKTHIRDAFNRIDTGKNTSLQKILNEFSISEYDYKKWLKSLFILIFDNKDNHETVLQSIIKNILEDRNILSTIFIYNYTDKKTENHVLLSDRGFIILETNDGSLAYYFNINHKCFIMYSFTDPVAFSKNKGINNETISKHTNYLQSKRKEILI